MSLKHIFSILLISAPLLAGCQENKSDNAVNTTPHAAASPTAMQNQAGLSGKIAETQDAGGYTYVKILVDKQPIWAAGPITKVQIGDEIGFNSDMPMNDFYSKALQKDFKSIYFVDHFTLNGVSTKKPTKAQKLDPHQKKTTAAAKQVALKPFSKLENGQTISEILQNATKLSDQKISIRGQVSKFTAGVMGKNWIHIIDSSSKKDLTITTDSTATIDDIIVIEGKLTLNKDFGYGYVYDVIIEDGKVTAN